MQQMNFSDQKVQQLETALNKLGAAAGFDKKEDSENKLELLRKVEMRFNDMVE